MNHHHTRIMLTTTLLVGTLCLTGITSMQDERSVQQAQEQVMPQYPVEVFRLQHGDADQVRDALRGIIYYRPERGENFAVEASTNSLLLSLSPERMEVARPLIAELDLPGTESQQQSAEVIHLEYADLRDVLTLVQTVFPTLRIAADPRNNAIIAQTSSHQGEAMRALIAQVDTPDSDDLSRHNQQLQLRVIWLIEGADGVDRTPPDDLQPVLNELERYGVGQLSLAGQSVLQITPGTHFEHSFAAAIDNRWHVEINGSTQPSEGESWRTDLGLSAREWTESDTNVRGGRSGATQAGFGSQSRIVHATTIITKSGRFVVLAMSPTDDMTSIFVVQLTEIES